MNSLIPGPAGIVSVDVNCAITSWYLLTLAQGLICASLSTYYFNLELFLQINRTWSKNDFEAH